MSVTKDVNYHVEDIKDDILIGYHFKQNTPTYNGVLVCFGGSEGGCNYDVAEEQAQRGYDVLALYFFGKNHQNEQLTSVPIELFEHIQDYIESHCSSAKPLTFISASKGAELCLNYAEYYPGDYNMILYAPTAYRYQGLDFRNPSSSWTKDGVELPYLSFKHVSFKEKCKFYFNFFVKKRVAFHNYYQSALDNAMNIDESRFKIINFQGHILLFAGDDDKMWNSATMAKTLKLSNPDTVECHVYANAGHCFDLTEDTGRFLLGGTKEGNQHAYEESELLLKKTLEQWHGK